MEVNLILPIQTELMCKSAAKFINQEDSMPQTSSPQASAKQWSCTWPLDRAYFILNSRVTWSKAKRRVPVGSRTRFSLNFGKLSA
jgi:hypothetical protein